MPSSYLRKIIDMRKGSCVITLPKAWLRYFGLKPGDKLEVIANGELTIHPLKESETIGMTLPAKTASLG